MREAEEDPNLAEVKAVLKKLQRLDVPRANGQPERVNPAKLAPKAPPAKPHASRMPGIFDRKLAAVHALGKETQPESTAKVRSTLLYATAALLAVAFLLVIFAITIFSGKTAKTATAVNTSPDSGTTTSLSKPDEASASLLTRARQLLNDGDILNARKYLLTGQPEEKPELALMLAQTYDPNFLRALPKANDEPDRAQAERWYRKWYELAQKSGLKMDSERLQRIINAM